MNGILSLRALRYWYLGYDIICKLSFSYILLTVSLILFNSYIIQEPYTNGKYHGLLEFPPSYPMAPPSIRMLTPSGRFQVNTPICMSMSNFHAELWSPAWTVQTILIGLQSFMYEDSNQVGGMMATNEVRRQFARDSLATNMKNEIYVNYFCGEDGARNPQTKSADADVAAPDEPVCRFCHVSGDLVTPCECKGSSQYVHLACLSMWQKNVLLTQATHPKYQTKIDEDCNVCGSPFRYKGKSRKLQILEYTGGELSDRIRPGNMLITSRHSSEKNQQLMVKHPDITNSIMHWTESVFLILQGSTSAHVQAVNLSRPIAALNRMQKGVFNSYETKINTNRGVASVRHFVGGPMNESEPLAVVELRRHVAKENEVARPAGVCAFIYIYIYIYIYKCVCMCVYIYIYKCVCAFIYMCVCVFIYIYIYIYI